MTVPGIINRYRKAIDWKLLVFLLLFLDVKLVVKLAAIILAFFMQPGWRLGIRLRGSRLPLFYPAVMAIGVLNWLLYNAYSDLPATVAILTGLGFWTLCILAVHQVRQFVDRGDVVVIERTILVFFLINAAVSLAAIAGMVIETGAINPYRYQGQFQKYFISTGDYIKGISSDTSTTNAVLNAAGVLYFLYRRNPAMVLLCTAILLLTGSNLTCLLLFGILLLSAIFRADRMQRSMVLACFGLLAIFLVKISPQNNQYVTELYERFVQEKQPSMAKTHVQPSPPSRDDQRKAFAKHYLDSISTLLARSDRLPVPGLIAVNDSRRLELPEPSIHTAPFQHRDDTTASRKELLVMMQQEHDTAAFPQNRPGKLIALQQTIAFFLRHPEKILTGDGTGNFSSKLAFRTTGLQFAGGYPQRFRRIDSDFQQNHLAVYSYFFSRRSGLHSAVNAPNNAYDQLAGEYGLLGCLAFLFLYLRFFLKKEILSGYGLPLLLLLLSVLGIDYWFEQLSIVPFFELLLLLQLKVNTA